MDDIRSLLRDIRPRTGNVTRGDQSLFDLFVPAASESNAGDRRPIPPLLP